jgi:hypothetical protein
MNVSMLEYQYIIQLLWDSFKNLLKENNCYISIYQLFSLPVKDYVLMMIFRIVVLLRKINNHKR